MLKLRKLSALVAPLVLLSGFSGDGLASQAINKVVIPEDTESLIYSSNYELDSRKLIDKRTNKEVTALKELGDDGGYYLIADEQNRIGIVSSGLMAAEDSKVQAVAIAFSERVEVLLPEFEPGTSIEVFLNGKPLAIKQDINSFTHFLDTSEPELLYQVYATSLMPRAEWHENFSEEEISSILNGDQPFPETGYTWGLQVLKPMDSKQSLESVFTEVQPLATSSTYSEFIYRTFIASPHAPSGYPACSPGGDTAYRFVGDNRSWSRTSTKFRTNAKIYYNWGAANATLTKNIGTTVRQKYLVGLWHNDATKTASSAQITLDQQVKTTTHNISYFVNKAKNPFCTYGAESIQAKMGLTVHRSGSYSVTSGSRRAVPHHEAYIMRQGKPWVTVFQKPIGSLGFDCFNPFYNLAGLCSDSLLKAGSY